ncbi:GmrSD restriction endonuclease domain-containing protein [Bradyrhizobium sp. HKCCYLRH1065]|uniref:GmrSD restriction endonuclease domain-containing protein n=1 Tax=Bradyrhizobium TaxID=374 RepID=UPI003EBA1846
MKAIDRPFTKIINGITQFVIPVFQRDYSWTETQCEQLWKDLVAIAADPSERGHFLGSVVYISTGDSSAGFTRWLLVDGQQRVTTLILLLVALRDHIKESNWSGADEGPTARRVDAYFLKNLQEDGPRHHKLVLRRRDQATLRALLDEAELPADSSDRIRDNYEFFKEQLKSSDPDTVYRGIGRLIIVDVTLDRGVDDPQLIFESLNSTGMDLSQSDLIRNFILMRLQEQDQTRFYDQYWCKIENLFRGSEKTFDAFVRDFLALHTQASKQEKTENIYSAFRREFSSIGTDTFALGTFLQKLLTFARYHAAFSIGTDTPGPLKQPFSNLRKQVDVPATLIMRLYACHDAGSLVESDFVRAVELLDSYVFRRAICGEQTRGYWQVFANLAYRIDPSRPLESLLVGLALQRDAYRFPDNEEFRNALEERDIYGKRVCFDLLDRLENNRNREPTDTSGYSIEHVMPQNPKLSLEWRKMLGDNWREIQRQWVHRLGNLTLTGYNSTYSDRPFAEKKTIRGGFEESSVRLNRFIRDQSVWTSEEMEKRGKKLATEALSIWPSLTVDQRLVDIAREKEMRAQSLQQDVGKIPMTQHAKYLFDVLRTKLKEIDNNIIELAEDKSISYHGPDFFLEVLPRKNRLTLLLNLEFNEVDDPLSIARDTSEFKFIVNAVYEGGVLVSVYDLDDIEKSLPIIRQARERS